MILILMENGHSVKRTIRMSIILSVVSLSVVLAANLALKGTESHLGNTIHQAGLNGMMYIYNMVVRKITMALRLYSIPFGAKCFLL
jgi:hypothetical protein